jgi:hypothetical protein
MRILTKFLLGSFWVVTAAAQSPIFITNTPVLLRQKPAPVLRYTPTNTWSVPNVQTRLRLAST